MDVRGKQPSSPTQLRQEHHELKVLLKRLSDVFDGDGPRDELSRSLAELRDELDEHFHHEEDGGYFDEIMERAPRLEAKVEELKQQHPALLALVRQLEDYVENAGTDGDAMARIQDEYRAFVRVLTLHEVAENDLLQQAYTEDIGTND